MKRPFQYKFTTPEFAMTLEQAKYVIENFPPVINPFGPMRGMWNRAIITVKGCLEGRRWLRQYRQTL